MTIAPCARVEPSPANYLETLACHAAAPPDSGYLSLSRYPSFFRFYVTDFCQISESFRTMSIVECEMTVPSVTIAFEAAFSMECNSSMHCFIADIVRSCRKYTLFGPFVTHFCWSWPGTTHSLLTQM